MAEPASHAEGTPDDVLPFEPSGIRVEVAAVVLGSLLRAQASCDYDEFSQLIDRANRVATSISFLAGAAASGFVGGVDAYVHDRQGYGVRVAL